MKNNNNNFFLAAGLLLLCTQSHMQAKGWFSEIIDALFSTPRPTYNAQYHHYHENTNNGYTLTESQAKRYIDQCIASFDFALRPYMNDGTQFDYLKKLILDTVRNAQHTYTYTNYGKRYKKDSIDQYINSAILQYIEEKSYNYAYYRTKNRTVAKKIAESMRNNAMAMIDKNGHINPESLRKFVGQSLVRAVSDAINRFDVPYQPDFDTHEEPAAVPAVSQAVSPEIASAPEEKLYPSEDCCVCYESFKDVSRIFLKPCGHDICKDCAFKWFFGEEQGKTCPMCRTEVDFNRLSQDIA